ncbi:glucose-1-phosphate cytidylyltransferase [Aliivibrio fischeri]|uniref:glucose-1-phosphate cytidylyltransferase n=1 Tax=Aliivibrio fischeri TaxID=668 RepID=UPI000907E582|nr:glucose-1-phosphate cytidylyltransferase [Aliivibrio fischeri]MUH96845.1 glucose-1-phosphate cytidylyltransferase [Aliivibrio fischeri]MUI63824.1 glucose-1-phosphate cytidylyltransferase [Aliivibrio fischeri]MUJ37265.1 glucose-1-phosphate cytidylyltransferase [Aliivibrio fischeri]MUK61345.1 glucose-1-phosphate cytidylyltransferase [Aliivibrio fischeri]MUL19466.1 glucose-1-phosphate cytidylyltransferase [Aliivibrio fischeri]
MKVLLLAGGFGTRLSEETDLRPKPMVEIGGKPILWHIMKMYSQHGYNDFVILLGYKSYFIKEYFANYFLHQSDVTIDLKNNEMKIHKNTSEPWTVTLLDTGLHSMTGGRVKRAQEVIGDEPFMLTYGDGVSDVNITELVEFHKSHGKAITMTSVQPDGRFGAIEIEGDKITQFLEKPKGDGSWINGGFFVCQPEVFDYITEGDSTVFEQAPLQKLAESGELYSYKHHGFWKCMDTLKDKTDLDEMLKNNKAKWKSW